MKPTNSNFHQKLNYKYHRNTSNLIPAWAMLVMANVWFAADEALFGFFWILLSIVFLYMYKRREAFYDKHE